MASSASHVPALDRILLAKGPFISADKEVLVPKGKTTREYISRVAKSSYAARQSEKKEIAKMRSSYASNQNIEGEGI